MVEILEKKILKNTFWLTISEIFNRGSTFLIAIWLARYLGPSLYGKWSFALSFSLLFAIVLDFGFTSLTIREIARDKSKTSSYISNISTIKLILGIIILILITSVAIFFKNDQELTILIYLLGLYVFLNSLSVFFQSIFRAHEKMKYETFARVVQNFLLLAIVAFFIMMKSSVITIGYSFIISSFIGAAVSLSIIWRYFSRIYFKIDLRIWKEILKEVWPFALSSFIVTLYFKIGVILLFLFKTNKAVGWYNAAYNLAYTFTIIPSLLMTSIYPQLSMSFKNNILETKKFFERSLKYIILISVIIFPILLIFSKYIILTIYGASYIPSIFVFRIIVIGVLFSFFSCVFMYVLNALNKQIIYTSVVGLCLIVNLLLCFILIPKYSYIGLSVIILTTEFMAFTILFIYLDKFFKDKKIDKIEDTGERVIVNKNSDYDINYLRHMAAYMFISDMVHDKIILDNGSGSGYGSYYLATKGAQKVIGVDISEKSIEYAKKRYYRDNLEFETMDSSKLNFDDESFDIIISFQVIEHIKHIEKFLCEIKRTIKDLGFVMISTPNKKTYSPGKEKPQNPFHLKEFYLNEFYMLLKRYFCDVRIFGVKKNKKMENFEKSINQSSRTKILKILKKLNLFSVLKLIPRFVKIKFKYPLKNAGAQDFIISEEDLENSLDFIVICRKNNYRKYD